MFSFSQIDIWFCIFFYRKFDNLTFSSIAALFYFEFNCNLPVNYHITHAHTQTHLYTIIHIQMKQERKTKTKLFRKSDEKLNVNYIKNNRNGIQNNRKEINIIENEKSNIFLSIFFCSLILCIIFFLIEVDRKKMERERGNSIRGFPLMIRFLYILLINALRAHVFVYYIVYTICQRNQSVKRLLCCALLASNFVFNEIKQHKTTRRVNLIE